MRAGLPVHPCAINALLPDIRIVRTAAVSSLRTFGNAILCDGERNGFREQARGRNHNIVITWTVNLAQGQMSNPAMNPAPRPASLEAERELKQPLTEVCIIPGKGHANVRLEGATFPIDTGTDYLMQESLFTNLARSSRDNRSRSFNAVRASH